MTAFVTAALRTAICPRGGGHRGRALHDLVAPLVAPLLAAGGIGPDQVDELILSNALGAGGNPARVAALAANLPERVAGLSLDRQCVGGLDAIALAAALVDAGRARAVIAGGVESFSRRPLRFAPGDTGPPVPYDAPPFTPWPDRDPGMAEAAGRLARRLGIGAADQAAYAVASHARARAADLSAELLALPGAAIDSFARDLRLATALRAPCDAHGISAATAAVQADGAALVLVTDAGLAARAARALRIGPAVTLGAAPEEPGLAPLPAIAAVLDRAGLTADDLAQVELMEAYAAQALATIRLARLPAARVNPKGGALARGHPIGASGTILAVRLFHDLAAGPGLAAIAGAGGLGAALILGA